MIEQTYAYSKNELMKGQTEHVRKDSTGRDRNGDSTVPRKTTTQTYRHNLSLKQTPAKVTYTQEHGHHFRENDK